MEYSITFERVHNGLAKLDRISFQNMQVKVQEAKQSDTLTKTKILRSRKSLLCETTGFFMYL